MLKDAADDDHRMGPHDVDHLIASKLPEMVGANDRVFVTTPHIIHPRFELNDIVDVRLIFHRPVHTTTNAAQRISSPGVAAGQLLKSRDHAIRIEAAIRKIDVSIKAKLQLSAPLHGGRVDPFLSQALQVVLT